jgi:hypothetical protein
MVKRVFWVALGATVGVLVVNRASKTMRKFTPSGIAQGAGGLPGAITGRFQEFADDVRNAAAEREFELYRVLGVDAKDPEELR